MVQQLDIKDQLILENCIDQAIQNADAYYPLSVRRKAAEAATKVLLDHDRGFARD